MKVFVKAKTLAKENKVVPPLPKLFKIKERSDEYFTVSVKEPPVSGKANKAIIKLLAEYFRVSIWQVRLVSGASSKIKVFEISD